MGKVLYYYSGFNLVRLELDRHYTRLNCGDLNGCVLLPRVKYIRLNVCVTSISDVIFLVLDEVD